MTPAHPDTRCTPRALGRRLGPSSPSSTAGWRKTWGLTLRRYPWPETFRQALNFLEERHPDGRGAKDFLRILALQEQVGERRLGDALELALRYHCVGADAVRHLLHRMETTWQPPLPLDAVPRGLALTVPARDLSQYNLLLSKA